MCEGWIMMMKSAPITSQAFRETMSWHAASVLLITTHSEGALWGATVTSFAPVSDETPTILVCLNQNSATRKAILKAQRFSMHMLGSEDEPIARAFASGMPSAERFQHGAWEIGADGTPRLKSALATMVCDLESVDDVGSHTILLGTVTETIIQQEPMRPLLYFRRAYTTL
jgi:flavin reductase